MGANYFAQVNRDEFSIIFRDLDQARVDDLVVTFIGKAGREQVVCCGVIVAQLAVSDGFNPAAVSSIKYDQPVAETICNKNFCHPIEPVSYNSLGEG
jgi:hypothetical protein